MTYWRERELKHINKTLKNDKKIAKKINRNQLRAMDEIEEQIEAFYGRYAYKEGISIAEARKRVAKADVERYRRKAKRYVKEREFTKRANEEMRLYNVTMQINRLELLKANIHLELLAMTSEEQRILFDEMTKIARAEYERQSSILGETINVNEKIIKNVVDSSLSTAKWSDLLWDNHDALRSELDRLLTRGMIQGRNPKVLARELRKMFKSSVHNSERLLRTEMAKIQGDIARDSYEQAGYEYYVWIAEPDACDDCADLDRAGPMLLKDAVVGVNFIPRHPNCRCSVSSFKDREEWEKDLEARGL